MVKAIRTLLLMLASISFIVVIGGAIYEHLTMVPVWTSAAPASLAMFQGDYAVAAFRFWIPIHPITVILLIAALVANWKTERRKPIALVLGGYILVLVVTFAFFVPELLSITRSAYSPAVDSALTQRAKFWESMSLVRLAWMLLLAVILTFGLTRSGEPQAPPASVSAA
jgi:hypothetical protein